MTLSWGWLLAALEFPGREATDVDVKLIETWVVAVAGELNLELKLGLRHRPSAD